jgi:hypothetical protein
VILGFHVRSTRPLVLVVRLPAVYKTWRFHFSQVLFDETLCLESFSASYLSVVHFVINFVLFSQVSE